MRIAVVAIALCLALGDDEDPWMDGVEDPYDAPTVPAEPESNKIPKDDDGVRLRLAQVIRSQMAERGRFNPPYQRSSPITEIEELHEVPSKEEFYTRYLSKNAPVVIHGAGLHSDAVERWTDEHMIGIAGDLTLTLPFP